MPSMAHVYRLFSPTGELLYVGKSMTPVARLAEHRSDKGWWADVGRIEVATFDTSDAASEAERQAIATENPRFNIMRPRVTTEEELDTSLRGQLLLAAKQAGAWTARRNELIDESHAQGQSLRAIGEACGLSHTAILKILRRQP